MEGREWFVDELIEQAEDVFILVDKELRIRYISPAVKRYGLEPMAVVGRSILDFAAPETTEKWWERLVQPAPRKTCEWGLTLKDNVTRYFDVMLVTAPDHQQVRAIQLHDVTTRKQREEELVKANRQLDQVIYKTTHDLRAPLLSALGLVNLADQAPENQRSEYLGLVRKSLLKLSGFIDEMHHFFRTEKLAIQCEHIAFDALMKDELDDLKGIYNAERIEVSYKTTAECALYSDKVRVKTILANLMTNAIKYADATKAKSTVQVTANITPKQLEFVVRDNGIGIEDEHHQRIFDLFYRATTQGQGTGLGLFIVKDTVSRLGGSITMESAPGKGSTFKVIIPNQVSTLTEVG
jgi:hypothetical protein